MATSVIHFGDDLCSRILVLQSAGYRVHECERIPDLESALREPSYPAAVLMGLLGQDALASAIRLVRSRPSPPPLVLFSAHGFDHKSFAIDLLVPPFTAPGRWLRWIGALIEQSRTLRTESALLRGRSALLREEAAAAGERITNERRRAAQLLDEMNDFAECEGNLMLDPILQFKYSRYLN